MGEATEPVRSVPTGAPDRIELRALRVLGTHGVLEEERLRAQPFEVDVDLHAELSAAGRSDDLDDTVDYGALCQAVADAVAGPHADLLEHLAQRVADAVLGAAGPRGLAVDVTVRKLRPPVPHDLGSSAVTVRRRRP
ncbi:dihydroneopterin aldolase [Acidiferrimicrobium sp. IK]|uniref:dihydroneopterin aldolase n=1 Tax=Acidiferrimicrobium sp. IK TaxID=2871700 RepID=UPI0021CB027F|nr:dihydroneopterin aldolase [Acidiferrimicrobium sp. IK]